MKFLLFSDLHHHPGHYDGGTAADLALFEARALETGCDFILHAGDFCHGPTVVPDYVATYNSLRVKTYHCLGNHDNDESRLEDTLAAYRMPNDFYDFTCGGYRFVILNSGYYKNEDGSYTAYSMGNYYGKNRSHMPPHELSWLEKTVGESELPCILVNHESFERPDGVKNRDAVLDIIRAANKEKPHSVLMVINGHYHRDYIRMLDGVVHFDVNSASFDALPKQHRCYLPEDYEAAHEVGWTLVVNDPLHAIVTLEGTTIDIEGMESSLYMGITNEMSGNPSRDAAGRPFTPTIQSLHVTL